MMSPTLPASATGELGIVRADVVCNGTVGTKTVTVEATATGAATRIRNASLERTVRCA
jgi:hypothetical protein